MGTTIANESVIRQTLEHNQSNRWEEESVQWLCAETEERRKEWLEEQTGTG